MTIEPSIYRIGRSVTKVSAAFVLKDELSSGRMPTGPVQVSVQETNARAVKNAGGLYVLCGHPPGTFTVRIAAEFYLDEFRNVVIPGSDQPIQVTNIPLLPKPAYPFPEEIALLRGLVRREDGGNVRDVPVQAVVMQSQSLVKAKLAGPAAAGDRSISVKDVQGSLQAGDLLMIREAGYMESEFCRLTGLLSASGNVKSYSIAEPIRFRHADQTPLQLQEPSRTILTRTAETGEWAVPVPGMKAIKQACVITVEATGMQTVRRDAEIVDGQPVSTGVIRLSVH